MDSIFENHTSNSLIHKFLIMATRKNKPGAGNPMLKKGVSLNPNGRPKGAINKRTEKWLQLCDYLMDEGIERLVVALDKLEPKEFVDAYAKILCYIKPKLSSVDANMQGSGLQIIIKNELDSDNGTSEND